MNNLAVERRDFLESSLPLTPEFIRNIRLLGRRPTTQMITDNLIRKYGTHFLLSATLGGKQWLECLFLFKKLLPSSRTCLSFPITEGQFLKPQKSWIPVFCRLKWPLSSPDRSYYAILSYSIQLVGHLDDTSVVVFQYWANWVDYCSFTVLGQVFLAITFFLMI